MKTLKVKFRMNGLLYTLIKRNDVAVLYGIGGTYSDAITHWEVNKIYTRKDKYEEREAISTNEQFGRDLSRCFNNEKSALNYFDDLTERLNLLHGGTKSYTRGNRGHGSGSLVSIADQCVPMTLIRAYTVL